MNENDAASLGLEPRLADHRSQAARTATLPTAPPRQAVMGMLIFEKFFSLVENLNSRELHRVSVGISAVLIWIPRRKYGRH